MFKIGDKVCYDTEYFKGTKSELIAKYGTGQITSEEYNDPRARPRLRYVNIKWESVEKEC